MVSRESSLKGRHLPRSLHRAAMPPNTWGHCSYCRLELGHRRCHLCPRPREWNPLEVFPDVAWGSTPGQRAQSEQMFWDWRMYAEFDNSKEASEIGWEDRSHVQEVVRGQFMKGFKDQSISNFNVHTNNMEIWLKCRFWPSSSEVGLPILRF